MSEEIFLVPDVGEGLVEAEIVEWKVKVGDVVALNQPLVDIETAKAVVELPSPYAGTVVQLHGEVGDVMAVQTPLITFDTTGDGGARVVSPATPGEAPGEAPGEERREAVLVGYGVANEDAPVTRTRRRGTSDASGAPSPAPVPMSVAATVSELSPRSTPPVRLYAKQHGVELSTVTGSGRDGLITRDDVDRAMGRVQSAQSSHTAARVTVAPTGPMTSTRFVGRELEPWATGPKEERIAVKGVLRSMADAMVQSAFSAPHAAAWLRVDATKTMELLVALKQHPNMANVRLSPLTIVALAVCDAARHFPGINSSFDATTNEVIVRRSVNLGIAADTSRGLIVPNIKGADQLDLVAMASALSVLVEKARTGTTSPAEMLGTTLTITNVGPFGVDGAVAILPPGTGAIIAVGQIVKAPWVVDDQVVVRRVVEISMSFDHRQIDGALASAVLAHIGRFLADPATSLLAG
ncbi:MAG: 2-oxo acid dehydrogenase subunit E2 [Acidobacteria bacterium]|nr:2-oxo acid dehydrogenase subunit E2 [Acidobacteriota bacterium]